MPQQLQQIGENELQAIVADPSRFGELYDVLYERVYAYIYRRVFDVQSAQDITANSFYIIMVQQPNFRWQGVAQCYAWVFRIAMNEINQFYRRGKKYQLVEDWLKIDIAEDNMISEDIEREDDARTLHMRVERLPRKLRDVVELYYFAGLAHSEIAASLHIGENAARTRLNRAIEKLRKEYEQ